MTIYLFGGTKGGVGKSTMAANMAAWLAQRGRVLLVDGDVQGHAHAWASLRAGDVSLPPVAALRAAGTGTWGAIKAAAVNYPHVVVDAGGRDSQELRGAMRVADVLVMPFPPSQFDLYSVLEMQKLITEARRFNARLFPVAFVNKASTNWSSRDAERAHASVASVMRAAVGHVRVLQAFARCVESGRAVFEMGRPGEAAASEFIGLCAEIEEMRHVEVPA